MLLQNNPVIHEKILRRSSSPIKIGISEEFLIKVNKSVLELPVTDLLQKLLKS